jgi:hypothetical protein
MKLDICVSPARAEVFHPGTTISLRRQYVRRVSKNPGAQGEVIMVDKQPYKRPAKSSSKSKHDQSKAGDDAVDGSSKSAAVDRPGFDLGGSTGKTRAGTGVGLGEDAADNRRDRRLPGRR